MTEQLTRKQFLGKSAKYAAGIAVGGAGINLLLHNKGIASSSDATWPWPYKQLDVEHVRILGHDLFYDSANGGGCGYGAFGAIVQALKEAVGDPYTSIPLQLMYFGHGGGAEAEQTLCGAPNGASAVISLVCDKPTTDTLVSELIGWYTQTKLPTDISNYYAMEKKYGVNKISAPLAQNASGSPLCHVSVSLWSAASGFAVGDPNRAERCVRLVGDTASYAAQILNDHFNNRFMALYVPPADVAACEYCHTQSSTSKPSTKGKMECEQCHATVHESTSVAQTPGLPGNYQLEQNYPNPFNPSTNIQFSLPSQQTVNLSIYDVHGRLVSTLVNGQTYSPGNYRVNWDGISSRGEKVAGGVFNPSSTIQFALKKNSTVKLFIFSVLGQQMQEFDLGHLGAGIYSQTVDMSRFASGVYFYRIEAVGGDGERYVAMKKMALLK